MIKDNEWNKASPEDQMIMALVSVLEKSNAKLKKQPKATDKDLLDPKDDATPKDDSTSEKNR